MNKKVTIIIPTYKKAAEVAPMVYEIQRTAIDVTVIATCKDATASVNRNYGLRLTKTEFVIMADDDVMGFYNGWWEQLISPLIANENAMMVSARLYKADGSLGEMLGNNYNINQKIVDVADKELPGACIAIRNTGILFDEGFKGGGFEDTHYCWAIRKKYPNAVFLINNDVKLVHINRQYNQINNFDHNRKHFNKLTGQSR